MTLKPCPFCGTKPADIFPTCDGATLKCPICDLTVSFHMDHPADIVRLQNAKDRWNHRYDEDGPVCVRCGKMRVRVQDGWKICEDCGLQYRDSKEVTE